MMVGYALDHPGDTYRMWDPRTKNVHVRRDVIWLRRMFNDPGVVPEEIGENQTVIDANLCTAEAGEGNGNDGLDDAIAANMTTDEDDTADADVEAEIDDWIEGTSRSGRTIRPLQRLIEEMAALAVAPNYYAELADEDDDENGLVGAGLGGGFDVTTVLHVMKYKQGMKSDDKDAWMKLVDEEHQQVKDHQAWEAVPKDKVEVGRRVLTSTWAMKKKANGEFRARLNARGYEQVDGAHYDEDTKSAPVTNNTTIRKCVYFTGIGSHSWLMCKVHS
jgi:hypothetical protein